MHEENENIEFEDMEGDSEIIAKAGNLSGYVPSEVSNALEAFLGGVERFTCYIYKKTAEGQALCAKTENSIPEPDEIGNTHGGGKFRYVFKIPPKNGKGRPAMRDAWVSLSEAYDETAALARRKRSFEVVQPVAGNGQGGSVAMLNFAERMLDKVASPRPESGGQMEMFRMMLEMNDKAAERMEKMLERSEKNTKELIESIAKKGNGLSEMREQILLLKEMGGIFGGGEAKSILGEILEFAAPVATALVGRLGNSPAPAQIPAPPQPSEEEMSLVALVEEIANRIDELLAAMTEGPKLKRNVTISMIKKQPEFVALTESPEALEMLRAKIGDEKFNLLAETLKINI